MSCAEPAVDSEGVNQMAEKHVADEGLEQLDQLEAKIERAVEFLESVRTEKKQLQEENLHLRRKLAEQDRNQRILQERLNQLEKERDTVKLRVQRVLEQVDTLAQAAADAS
jgi:FtsZ-binding cell division protein ZapB